VLETSIDTWTNNSEQVLEIFEKHGSQGTFRRFDFSNRVG